MKVFGEEEEMRPMKRVKVNEGEENSETEGGLEIDDESAMSNSSALAAAATLTPFSDLLSNNIISPGHILLGVDHRMADIPVLTAAPANGNGNGNGFGNGNGNGSDNAGATAIPPVPLTTPPKHEQTPRHLHKDLCFGARVSVSFEGREYFGKVTRMHKNWRYVVEFDAGCPSKQRARSSKYLTVLPESWKDPPPARFLKDLKESERLQKRVSYYLDGKQFVGTATSKSANDRKYIVAFDDCQNLTFYPNKELSPGHLLLGDSLHFFLIPVTRGGRTGQRQRQWQ